MASDQRAARKRAQRANTKEPDDSKTPPEPPAAEAPPAAQPDPAGQPDGVWLPVAYAENGSDIASVGVAASGNVRAGEVDTVLIKAIQAWRDAQGMPLLK